MDNDTSHPTKTHSTKPYNPLLTPALRFMNSINRRPNLSKRPKMPHLPLELWFYIAEFIPPTDLPKLAGINRGFFELIMNELYSQLSFISSDPRIFWEKLVSLQSPGLIERVRVLTLWPGAVRDALKSQRPEKPQNDLARPPNPKPGHARYLLKGRNYVGDLLRHRRTPSLPIALPTPQPQLPPPGERLELFLSTIRKLNHIEELELSWYIDTAPKAEAWTFSHFPDLWRSIGQNLRKLTIDIQVSKMNDAAQQCGSLPQLEELFLTLRSSDARGHPGDTFVPYFINKFAPTLQSLSIKTIGHQELSQNFELLGSFPQLTRLLLNMPLDFQHLKDPRGLNHFLQNHPKLLQLSLRYTRCCTYSGWPKCDGFETFDGKHSIYNAITLPVLHSLELGLYFSPSDSKNNTLYRSVARMGDELTSLTLLDRNLKLDEIKAVFKAFPSHRLKKLSLFSQLLSPQLIDYIAQICPALNSLSLDVETVVKSEALIPPATCYVDDVFGFDLALSNYAVDLDNDRWRYRTWVLSDISVMKWERAGHVYIWECMDAIARVVPAVRSFASRGHMAHDNQAVPKAPARPQRQFLDIGDRTKPLDT